MLDPGRFSSLAPLRVLPGRNLSKATVSAYRIDGAEVALKDYGAGPFLLRQTLGRLLTRREAAAYAAAGGIAGIPEFLGRVGPFALATRWIDATPLASLPRGEVDPAVFDRVAAILDLLHGRGIALADLHHRDVLVGAGGSVHLVDLATAVCVRPGSGALRRLLFRRARDADRVALARMRARATGADEREAVLAAAGAGAAAIHFWGRRVKRLWDLVRRRGGPP